jgi:hypothetical protein
LLPSLNATNLTDNGAFIKRIWDRSKQLDQVKNDDEGRKLTQYGMKIYNIFEYFSYIISINSSIEIMEHDN